MDGYMIEQNLIVRHMDVKTIQISQHWDIGQFLLVLKVLEKIGALLMKVILAIILLTSQLIMVYAQL